VALYLPSTTLSSPRVETTFGFDLDVSFFRVPRIRPCQNDCPKESHFQRPYTESLASMTFNPRHGVGEDSGCQPSRRSAQDHHTAPEPPSDRSTHRFDATARNGGSLYSEEVPFATKGFFVEGTCLLTQTRTWDPSAVWRATARSIRTTCASESQRKQPTHRADYCRDSQSGKIIRRLYHSMEMETSRRLARPPRILSAESSPPRSTSLSRKRFDESEMELVARLGLPE
jgi:hypothetical protein